MASQGAFGSNNAKTLDTRPWALLVSEFAVEPKLGSELGGTREPVEFRENRYKRAVVLAATAFTKPSQIPPAMYCFTKTISPNDLAGNAHGGKICATFLKLRPSTAEGGLTWDLKDFCFFWVVQFKQVCKKLDDAEVEMLIKDLGDFGKVEEVKFSPGNKIELPQFAA